MFSDYRYVPLLFYYGKAVSAILERTGLGANIAQLLVVRGRGLMDSRLITMVVADGS